MGQRAPVVDQWYRDVREWVLAEEVHMKQSQKGEKLEDDVALVAVCGTFLRPIVDVETADSDDGYARERDGVP
ncbi:hypothetical protein NDU88_004287 [Pleurodeles waltl]|uniref:Uncharacterized protein n=1 Tax=Pleurodeles waltl TaxID=8319 RepID=A0AAV7WV40_PLEWA|nr:hypothetical protein NDU88_004287 [Pleurodeles waltl]